MIYRENTREKHPKRTIYDKVFGFYCSCGYCPEYGMGRPKLVTLSHNDINHTIVYAYRCLIGKHNLSEIDGDLICTHYCDEILNDNPSFIENYSDIKKFFQIYFNEIKNEIGYLKALNLNIIFSRE